MASAAALAALFNGAACSSGNGSAGRATSSQAPLPLPSTSDPYIRPRHVCTGDGPLDVDGWRNEGAAAAQLPDRAENAASPQDRAALMSMAEDEQRHADLARAIVTWCFDEEPVAVGRALARVAPLDAAA